MNKKDEKCLNNNCSDCQKWLAEKLASCEDWEVKRKEGYRKFELRFCPNQSDNRKNEARHPETGGYNYNSKKCPSCQEVIKIIKSNDHGDKTEELKEHAHTSACSISCRERERERESNSEFTKLKANQTDQSKSNYLPWILGGIGIFSIIVLACYFLFRKKEK